MAKRLAAVFASFGGCFVGFVGFIGYLSWCLFVGCSRELASLFSAQYAGSETIENRQKSQRFCFEEVSKLPKNGVMDHICRVKPPRQTMFFFVSSSPFGWIFETLKTSQNRGSLQTLLFQKSPLWMPPAKSQRSNATQNGVQKTKESKNLPTQHTHNQNIPTKHDTTSKTYKFWNLLATAFAHQNNCPPRTRPGSPPASGPSEAVGSGFLDSVWWLGSSWFLWWFDVVWRFKG